MRVHVGEESDHYLVYPLNRSEDREVYGRSSFPLSNHEVSTYFGRRKLASLPSLSIPSYNH